MKKFVWYDEITDMKKFVIYIAGPFRARPDASNQWEQTQNIRRAEELALSVWRAGHVAICPHMNTAHFQGACPDDVWFDGDLEILKRCDGVLLVPGWHPSKGTQKEINFAVGNNIPVHSSLDGLLGYLNGQDCLLLKPGCFRPIFSHRVRVYITLSGVPPEGELPSEGDIWLETDDLGHVIRVNEYRACRWRRTLR